MKILVQTDEHRICIPVPTGLLLTPVCVKLFLRWKPEGVLENVPGEAVAAVCKELRRIRRTSGSWNLLEAQARDGTKLLIRI